MTRGVRVVATTATGMTRGSAWRELSQATDDLDLRGHAHVLVNARNTVLSSSRLLLPLTSQPK